jgi:ribosome-associated translation inhibitor RaiA
MKIQISTDGNIEGSEALGQRVEAIVRAELERHDDRLTRIEVHLSDQDSQERGSGTDIRCVLEARPVAVQPVVVRGSADTVERACHDASEKMSRLLNSRFGRIDGRDGRATIRHNEAT